MQNSKSNPNPLFELLILLLLGVVIGFLTLGFINALSLIEVVHARFNQEIPYHLLLIPVVLFVIEITKRNTLYFPTKTAHISDEKTSHHWTVFMSFFHFAGTLLSHLSGVSVGRESAAVLYSAGLPRVFRLSWTFWGPIAGAMGFSAVVGQYWVAPFFMMELFGRTSFVQKIYSFMGSMLTVLILKSFGAHQLFGHFNITTEMGFFKKLVFLFFFALCAGILMRFYKKFYNLLATYFKTKSLWIKLSVSMILAFFLYLPEFRKFQSLGIHQFSELSVFSGSFLDSITKLFFTLISTSIGFLGGEFIPLIYAGVHLGSSFFGYFGFDALLGSVFGSFLLFTGATRFKWTGYILLLNLMGFTWWFWAYFVVSIAVGFSGPNSIYKKEISA